MKENKNTTGQNVETIRKTTLRHKFITVLKIRAFSNKLINGVTNEVQSQQKEISDQYQGRN